MTNTLVLPTSDGAPDQVLTTDGSGNLSWSSSSGGTVTGVTGTATRRLLRRFHPRHLHQRRDTDGGRLDVGRGQDEAERVRRRELLRPGQQPHLHRNRHRYVLRKPDRQRHRKRRDRDLRDLRRHRDVRGHGHHAENVTGTVAVGHGGTGATTQSAARANLGLGTLATKDPASLTADVSGVLPVANGGTGPRPGRSPGPGTSPSPPAARTRTSPSPRAEGTASRLLSGSTWIPGTTYRSGLARAGSGPTPGNR